MRIVAGVAGGIRLKGAGSAVTRPTTDKVREAVFNSLDSIGKIANASVLDLFAGTGACGIEALSRGARLATFVDNDHRAIDVVRANIAITSKALAHAEKSIGTDVKKLDALKFLESDHHFDVAFVDPPYSFHEWPSLLENLNAELAVCESNRDLTDIAAEVGGSEDSSTRNEKWEVFRTRAYGDTVVTILRNKLFT